MNGEFMFLFVIYEDENKRENIIKNCHNISLMKGRNSSRLEVNGITIYLGNNCYHSNPFKIARGIT